MRIWLSNKCPVKGLQLQKGSRDASAQSSLAITTREMLYITIHMQRIRRKCHDSKPLNFSDFTLSSTASSLNFATMFTENPASSNNLPQVPFSCVNTMDVPTASCWNIMGKFGLCFECILKKTRVDVALYCTNAYCGCGWAKRKFIHFGFPVFQSAIVLVSSRATETFGVHCFIKGWSRIFWQKAGIILQSTDLPSPSLGELCARTDWLIDWFDFDLIWFDLIWLDWLIDWLMLYWLSAWSLQWIYAGITYHGVTIYEDCQKMVAWSPIMYSCLAWAQSVK